MLTRRRKPAGADPQVDNELLARTLASFKCEGSFALAQRVERQFLGLAYKMVQLSRASLKNRLALNQGNQVTRGSLFDN